MSGVEERSDTFLVCKKIQVKKKKHTQLLSIKITKHKHLLHLQNTHKHSLGIRRRWCRSERK